MLCAILVDGRGSFYDNDVFNQSARIKWVWREREYRHHGLGARRVCTALEQSSYREVSDNRAIAT